MITLLSILALGFLLGMRHATDADHVIAVTTIVSRERRVAAAAAVGILWGVGHTLTILVAGGALIVFGVVIPPRVGLSMEFSVGLMLIVLGAITVRRVLRAAGVVAGADGHGHEVHSHAHAHGDYVHTHPHSHGLEGHAHGEAETPLARLDARLGGHRPYQMLRPLVVGGIHGLAGSAAITLLVLSTIHEPRWAVAYLVLFGVGTIVGMMLITAAIAVPFAYSAGRLVRVNRVLALGSGVLSVAFGLFVTYQIGLVDGLLRW
jgi:high-affinity nickel-transport protein